MYIGKDGARYVVTQYPFQVDAFGELQAKHTSLDKIGSQGQEQEALANNTMEDHTTKATMNKASPSNKPTGSGMSTNPYMENLFEDLNFNEK